MPGYNLSELDRNRIPGRYFCTKCSLLLRDPAQMKCGHLYCTSCIDGNVDMKCVACGEISTNFPDKCMKRELSSLNFHCLNKDQGCPWKGRVTELESHKSECDFNQIFCPYSMCGKIVKKSELATHFTKECEYRLVKCDCCNAEMSFNSVKGHENVCRNMPVRCNMCGKVFSRWQVAQHQEPSRRDHQAAAGCPSCKLEDIVKIVMETCQLVQSLTMGEGRPAPITLASTVGRDASEAVASSTAGLLAASESALKNLVSRVEGVVIETRDLRKRLREQSERLTSVDRRTVSLRSDSNDGVNTIPFPNSDPASTTQAEVARRLVNVENKAADHDILLVENNKSVEDVRRQNSYLQRQLELSQENVRRLEWRVESQDHMLALRNVALADLEEYIRQQEVSSYDGILLWNISDFARRRSDAQGGRQTYFYSPSFYTSRHGYKMCARIYLNGDGMGKGTHISLFIVVMRGQYDALLRWPFRQKVTLMIMDQDNVEHVMDAFRPDPNSSSFQKPRREMNIASGCPLFFSLSDLDTHAYVRDDTMFVKIIVDISEF